MKKIFFLISIFFLPVITLSATVDLQFSTEPQTIGLNQFSKITVRVSSPAAETIYFLPQSSSATGQFTPYSTGRTGSYYISRGDSTKSFYYKDSTVGSFTIKILPDTSKGTVFPSIEQEIKVSSTAVSGSIAEGETSDQADDSDESNTSEGGGSFSVHTGETSLSNYKKETLQIGAGRERLATVRTPITFSASQNKIGKQTSYFSWSFGDGTSAVGAKVYHSYQFPGRYNVVLNGVIDGEEGAVARTIVLVTESQIKITELNTIAGYVEIANNSDKEQNLNSWFLQSGDKKYVFPTDTIISPKTSIKIPLKSVGFLDQNIKEVILNYPDGGIASTVNLLAKRKRLTAVSSLADNPVKSSGELEGRDARALEKKTQVEEGVIKPKNVVILKQEPSWFEKIKNAIFK